MARGLRTQGSDVYQSLALLVARSAHEFRCTVAQDPGIGPDLDRAVAFAIPVTRQDFVVTISVGAASKAFGADRRTRTTGELVALRGALTAVRESRIVHAPRAWIDLFAQRRNALPPLADVIRAARGTRCSIGSSGV